MGGLEVGAEVPGTPPISILNISSLILKIAYAFVLGSNFRNFTAICFPVSKIFLNK